VSPTRPITTAADWTVPPGVTVNVGNTPYGANSTVPAGSVITSISPTAIPMGTMIPSPVFPQGIPLSSPYLLAAHTAGEVLTSPVTLPAGLSVPAGAVFAQSVAIKPVLSLSTDLFQSGFSHYNISSSSGMEVAAGTPIAPTVPVYQFAP